MKLAEWAREQGVSTDTILFDQRSSIGGTAVAYCRVSSADHRAGVNQAGRVAEECGTRGITLAATVVEIGSGLEREPD